MVAKVKLTGTDFKALVSALNRFPALGSFAESEVVSFRASQDKAIATSLGTVLTRAAVPAQGDFPLTGIDSRYLASASAITREASNVTISLDNQVVTIKAGTNELTVAAATGQDHKFPSLKTIQPLTFNKHASQSIQYLAAIAFADNTRPELGCVYLTDDGRAVAVNQKTNAVLRLGAAQRATAVPVAVAKILVEGDKLYCGELETIVRSGIAYYVVPSPVAAQKNFPIVAIDQYGAVQKSPVATCTCKHLAQALLDCKASLTAVTRTEVIVRLLSSQTGLELAAESGGAKFRAKIKATIKLEAELFAPLEEIIHIAPFLDNDQSVMLSRGTNGELFINFPDGYVMHPAYRR